MSCIWKHAANGFATPNLPCRFRDPYFIHRTRYNAQAMHKVLDSSKRCLHTYSRPMLIAYRVPVTAMASLGMAAQTTFHFASMKATVSAASHSRHGDPGGIDGFNIRLIGAGLPYLKPIPRS
ncbi:hypothetical protein BU25DRAFT_172163 [Macroventuria anomochaeta]|uniref:Uncharacterized protein n=1 Tax=Macroventuria anomochaeta TaxID=301207 RepID=A0ACB6RQU8_9PLEO|nr:uncharacterized protein BU25DRAFT_172163 [Macroventuria anomochaeta]KAF2623652.1 hypothetical protein BU25DRAFT_172163 [Macroventuria anomochaeta]